MIGLGVTLPSLLSGNRPGAVQATTPSQTAEPSAKTAEKTGKAAAFELFSKPAMSAGKAFETLKVLHVMEKVSGKPTDPQFKFDFVKRASPAMMEDMAETLAGLPKFGFENTSGSQEEAREVFERMEIFAWALSSATQGLAERDGVLPGIASGARFDTVSALFDLMEEKAAEAETMEEAGLKASDQASPEDQPRQLTGMLGVLVDEVGQVGGELNDMYAGAAKGLEAMATRDDDFALIGQLAIVFTYAQSLLEQNPNLLGDGTGEAAEKQLMNVLLLMGNAAQSLHQIEDRTGSLPSQRLDLTL